MARDTQGRQVSDLEIEEKFWDQTARDAEEDARADTYTAAHTCPVCGTPAPECYDDEVHPSWDCSVCLAAPSDDEE